MINRFLFLCVVSFFMASTSVHAVTGDAASGRLIAKKCESCHGQEGVNRIAGFPNLAGQNYGYLVNQLEAMRDSAKLRAGFATFSESDAGSRKQARRSSVVMDQFVIGLSDLAIADVAAYYASLPCLQVSREAPLPPPRVTVRCKLCHGENGIARDTNVPNLAGQDALYQEQQLKSYKLAKLQSGDGQEARRSIVMEGQVRSLKESDMNEVAAYYARMPCSN